MEDLVLGGEPLTIAGSSPPLGHVAISLGIEDHASFAWQGANATRSCVAALRTVVASELVAALRALRRHADVGPGSVAGQLQDLCAALPDEALDHALVDDLAAADALLDRLGAEVAVLSAAEAG